MFRTRKQVGQRASARSGRTALQNKEVMARNIWCGLLTVLARDALRANARVFVLRARQVKRLEFQQNYLRSQYFQDSQEKKLLSLVRSALTAVKLEPK